MHDHAGRLVDDHQVVVLVDDAVGDLLGAVAGRRDDLLGPRAHSLARPQAVAARARLAAHAREAGVEQPLRSGARAHLRPRGESDVQALALVLRTGDELDHLPSITYRRPRIPRTIAASATLNAGQNFGSMKS